MFGIFLRVFYHYLYFNDNTNGFLSLADILWISVLLKLRNKTLGF